MKTTVPRPSSCCQTAPRTADGSGRSRGLSGQRSPSNTQCVAHHGGPTTACLSHVPTHLTLQNSPEAPAFSPKAPSSGPGQRSRAPRDFSRLTKERGSSSPGGLLWARGV